MYDQNILLVGCGDVAIRAGKQLHRRGAKVFGLRRNIKQIPDEIIPIAADITSVETLHPLKNIAFDLIVITLTAKGEASYRSVYVDGLRNLLEMLAGQSTRPYILFASSTSVYAQNAGELVDEESEAYPQGYSGLAMLAAEQLLDVSEFPSTSIRFSGIYGADRGDHLVDVLKSGRISPVQPIRYSNRIHVDDCVGVILHLFEHFCSNNEDVPSSYYLASDLEPTPLSEVMVALAHIKNLDINAMEPNYLPSRGGNKRCSSLRLQRMGYQFLYPSYREGYGLR